MQLQLPLTSIDRGFYLSTYKIYLLYIFGFNEGRVGGRLIVFKVAFKFNHYHHPSSPHKTMKYNLHPVFLYALIFIRFTKLYEKNAFRPKEELREVQDHDRKNLLGLVLSLSITEVLVVNFLTLEVDFVNNIHAYTINLSYLTASPRHDGRWQSSSDDLELRI